MSRVTSHGGEHRGDGARSERSLPGNRSAWRESVSWMLWTAVVATLAATAGVWLAVERWLTAGSSVRFQLEAGLMLRVPAAVAAWCWRAYARVRDGGPTGPRRGVVSPGPRATLVCVGLIVEVLARAAGELHPDWSARLLAVRFAVLALVGVLIIADAGWDRANQT